MKYGAVIGLLLLNADLGWAQTQDELIEQSSTSSAYANVDAQYLYSSWQPSKIVNATTEATGRNLIKFSLDPSPSIPYIKCLEYWWTPGDSADQKELIEREAEGDSVLSATSAPCNTYFWVTIASITTLKALLLSEMLKSISWLNTSTKITKSVCYARVMRSAF